MTLVLGPSLLDRGMHLTQKSPDLQSSCQPIGKELAKELSPTGITRQILFLRCTNALSHSLSTEWKVVGEIHVVGKQEEKLKHCWRRGRKIAWTIHEDETIR